MLTKPVKLVLIGIPAFIAVLLVGSAAAFFLASEDVLTGWLVTYISGKADADIRFESIDLDRGLTTRINVEQLEVVAHDKSYSLDSSYFRLSVRLPQLLLARLDFPTLAIGDTRVNVQGDAEGDTRDWLKPGIDLDALRLRPVLHEVSLENLSVSAEGSEWTLPSRSVVSELSLQLTPDDHVPELSASIQVVDKKLEINATLPDFHQSIGKQRLPFNIRVNRPFATLDLRGDIDFSQADASLRARLELQIDKLSEVPVIGALQIPGSLKLTADVDGSFDKLPAESITGYWQAGDAGGGDLTGRVDNLVGLDGIALAVKARAENADWLQPYLPDSMGQIRKAGLSFSLSGPVNQLIANDIKLQALTADELDLELSGKARLARTDSSGYDLKDIVARLDFASPTTHAARALLFEQIPEFGAVQAGVDIRSKQGHPTLSNIRVSTRHPKGIKGKIDGVIDSFPLDPNVSNSGYHLDVSIQSPESQPVLDVLNLEYPLAGPFDITFKINGDTSALQLNAIRLQAGKKQALDIAAGGRMLFGDWSQDDPLESLNITVDAYSHTTQAFAAFFDEDWPDLGALNMHAQVNTVAGKHRIDSYSLTTVDSASVQVAMTGNAASLAVFPAPFASGIRLAFVAHGADTADLNQLFRLRGNVVPPIGPFRAEAEITGNDDVLNVRNVQAQAGSRDVLLISVNGDLGKVGNDTGWVLSDSNLALTAESSSSQALAKAWGYSLPSLGPLSGTAEIHDKDKSFGLDKLLLRVGDDSSAPVMVAEGNVGDLYQVKDVDIDVKLNIDGHSLAAFADRHSLADLSPIRGELHVADKNGVLGIQTLRLGSDHPDLRISVDGRYSDFSKPETLTLKTDIEARDLALLGALFDQQWPDYGPLTITGDAGRDGGRSRLNARARAGEKGIDADLFADFNASPPAIAGKVAIHHLSLPDFYEKAALVRKEREKLEKESGEKASKKDLPPVFPDEPIGFDVLNNFDLALSLDVPSFDPTDSEAVSAESTIRLKSGVLTVRPAVIRYPKGELTVDASIDARKTPELSLKANGKNINPWLGQVNRPDDSDVDANAEMDVDVVLSAQGESPHKIASSLDGSLYLTIKHGKMKTSFTDLLFVDIVGWTANRVKDQKYHDLRCGVADFTASRGVITTNGFLIDTNNIAITGDGTVDLGKEEVDYVFLPKKKSRLILKAEPVKVTGSLGDPAVTAIPVKSAALTFGTLIFAPYVFVGMTASEYVTGKMRGEQDDTPCLTYERAKPKTDSPKASTNKP